MFEEYEQMLHEAWRSGGEFDLLAVLVQSLVFGDPLDQLGYKVSVERATALLAGVRLGEALHIDGNNVVVWRQDSPDNEANTARLAQALIVYLPVHVR